MENMKLNIGREEFISHAEFTQAEKEASQEIAQMMAQINGDTEFCALLIRAMLMYSTNMENKLFGCIYSGQKGEYLDGGHN